MQRIVFAAVTLFYDLQKKYNHKSLGVRRQLQPPSLKWRLRSSTFPLSCRERRRISRVFSHETRPGQTLQLHCFPRNKSANFGKQY